MIAPFLMCMSICIPAYALTPEEKEWFDALGVDYSLDENGNFKEFHADVNMERMSYEKKLELAEKYKDVEKVGSYNMYIYAGETPNDFEFRIADKDYNDLYSFSKLTIHQ